MPDAPPIPADSIINITAALRVYMLPEAGDQFVTDYLSMFRAPAHSWVRAFNFSLPPLFEDILALDAGGITGDIIVDRSQAQTPSEKQALADFVPKLTCWNLTVGEAGIGSQHTSQIDHNKLTILNQSDGPPAVIFGSTNISTIAQSEGNIQAIAYNYQLACAAVDRFNVHVAWDRSNTSIVQLMPTLVRPTVIAVTGGPQ